MGKIVNIKKKKKVYRLYFTKRDNSSESTLSSDTVDFEVLKEHAIEGWYMYENVSPNKFTSSVLKEQLKDIHSMVLSISDVERIEVLTGGMEIDDEKEKYIEFIPDFELEDDE